jgi:hypothetical protein
MKRWFIVGVALTAVLAACGGSAGQAPEMAPETTETVTSSAADVTAGEPVVADSPPVEPASSPTATAGPTGEDESLREEPLPDEVAGTEAAVDYASQYGAYEKTYFRGRADAPITMFDYSDFL